MVECDINYPGGQVDRITIKSWRLDCYTLKWKKLHPNWRIYSFWPSDNGQS